MVSIHMMGNLANVCQLSRAQPMLRNIGLSHPVHGA
jgi:hypothetical protein